MKIFVSIALSTYYLLVSLGILVNVHYCGGKVQSVEVYAPAKACCCPVAEGKMHGCCGDESFFYQFDEEQVSSQTPQETEVSSGVLTAIVPTFYTWVDALLADPDISPAWAQPPPYPDPLWLRHCSLIFYG